MKREDFNNINNDNDNGMNDDSRMSRLNRDHQNQPDMNPNDVQNNHDYDDPDHNGYDSNYEPHDSDRIVGETPIKHHHYVRDTFIGIAVVFCLLVDASWYTNHEESNQANNQPQTTRVNKTVNNTTNNYQKPASQQPNNQIRHLQTELNSMGLQQQQTQQLLNKFANIQNANTRNEIYKHAQLVRYVPVQPIQRTIIEKVLQ